MVKKRERSVNDGAQFHVATDALLVPMSLAGLAEALDCSVSALRQARLNQKSSGFRNPPGGWEVTVRRLLEARANHFTTLAKRLSPKE